MGKIAILPEILCNQIAAGEVVERPAAVVKELVENSIDAQSSKISVSLLQGGRKEIRIIDNGCGMLPDDALLALERHATSKIRSAEDLLSIGTLGFRGEALPSIASVSRFELITREPESLAGIHIKVDGGVLKDVREKGCPPGTQICVRDLFHNVPARRKFLRTAETELAYITDQFMRISMAHPEIHMQLHSQERLQCDFLKAANRLQRAGQVLGTEISKSLSPVEFEKNGLRVDGFLAPPDIQRTNSQYLFLFVNGRPVWDRLLQRAALTAYEALIPRGKFPVAVLFIEISPALVDVNVHPAKREIRFRNPGEVIETVRESILSTLAVIRPRNSQFAGQENPFSTAASPRDYANQPAIFRETQASFDFRQAPRRPAPGNFAPDTSWRVYDTGPSSPQTEGGETASLEQVQPSPFTFSSLPLIGQLANSFILLEASDGLILIDQHAAHERILFNNLGAKSSSKAAQLLTLPVILELLPSEAVLLKKWSPGLAEIGFEIEPFGGSSFAVKAVPAVLSDCRPEDILRDFLKFAEEECPASESSFLSGLAKIASCHGAIKAGQRLKPEEIKHLLASLDATDVPFTCPHGRPLWFKLTYDQIYRFFKRT
jgi:DNA mismatch repair protein MutL